MTKDSLVKNIISAVENGRLCGDTDAEIATSVKSLIDPLEPKDREMFSQWGYPDDRTTPESCW